MACKNSKQQIERAGVNALATCTAPYRANDGSIRQCNCPYSEHVDETLTGSESSTPEALIRKRPRALSGEEARDNTASLRFCTKNISYTDPAGTTVDSRTCFFVGQGTLREGGDGSVKGLWISARHAGKGSALTSGTEASLHFPSATQVRIPAMCVFDCEASDIALLTTDTVPANMKFHQFASHNLHEKVYAAGFGDASDIGDGTPTIATGTVVRCKTDKKMKFHAEGANFRCNRFFFVEMVADYGFSGGPVYNSFGYVLGMLCAGDESGLPLTFVLSASHLEDAIQDVFVRV